MNTDKVVSQEYLPGVLAITPDVGQRTVRGNLAVTDCFVASLAVAFRAVAFLPVGYHVAEFRAVELSQRTIYAAITQFGLDSEKANTGVRFERSVGVCCRRHFPDGAWV